MSGSRKNMTQNNCFEINGMRLSSEGVRALTRKVLNEAEVPGSSSEMPGTQKAWVAVITQAFKDLSNADDRDGDKKRVEAFHFLNNRLGDIERVCEYAGLNHEALVRIIKKVLEVPGLLIAIPPAANKTNKREPEHA